MMKSRKKEFKRKYFGSLTHQLILISICLVTGTLLLCWFINTVFLEPYYVINKQNTLLSGFETIDEASEAGTLDDSSFDVTFDNLCANGNITVMIISSDRTIVRSSVNDTQKMMLEFMNIIFGEKQNEVTVMMQSDNYIIQKQTDTRLDSEFLVLYGTLSNGNLILMRTALESIRESVNLSNTFLACVGVVAAIISAVVIVFVSRGITTPLLRLTDISKRMTELDFEAKYPVNTEDEIGKLGNSINLLSERLEETISELKSANNELQKDIENKIQIDEMRKDFLSNVSHELKTPIALIQGYAEGLHDNINDDSESREFYCDVIIDEANKMNKMVKKLLTLNQIEFGKNQITFERFDIVQVVRSVIQSATLLAEQKGAEIYMEETEPVYVWADEYMVEEIVTNYISNAINHVDGEKRIRVTLEMRENVVRVRVFNTGNQIPEDELDKIWIKFYKVDKARTRAYGGSGIGLSIVKAIVDSMNQQCGVRNCQNGVEFWFDLDRKS